MVVSPISNHIEPDLEPGANSPFLIAPKYGFPLRSRAYWFSFLLFEGSSSQISLKNLNTLCASLEAFQMMKSLGSLAGPLEWGLRNV